MSILQAIVLGAVQGLTELLPVSSSAHLVLVPAALGWAEPSVPFAVAVHVGTALALCVYFRRDLKQLTGGTWRWALRRSGSEEQAHQSRQSARLVGLLLLAAIPAGIAGPLAEGAVASVISSPAAVGGLLLVTALILFVCERLSRSRAGRGEPTWKDALWIGVAQALALPPGISRSGMTISVGLVLGLEAAAAVRFAFLMSIPVILGGGLVEGLTLVEAPPAASELLSYVVGAVVAGACAWLAIVLVFAAVRKGKFAWYSLYCALVGLAAIVAALLGVFGPAGTH